MIININKSYILITTLATTHAGALGLLFFMPMALGVKIGLALLIGGSYWWQNRNGKLNYVCTLKLEEDGSCIRTGQDVQLRYQIASASIHAGFVRLTLLRTGERKRVQLILRDALDKETYHGLCARIVQRRLPVLEQTTA